MSLAHSGQLSQALAIADRHALPLLNASATGSTARTQCDCYSGLSEVFLLSGRLPDAVRCARTSLEYAGDDEPRTYRATTLVATAQALNGEFSAAARQLARAASLDDGRGWSKASWPLALAATQISFRSEDLAPCERLLDDLDGSREAGTIEDSVWRLGSAWLAVARGDYRAATVHCRALALGVAGQAAPRFLLDLGLSVEALALAHLGQPGAVLTLIGRQESPPGHAVCFELHRASVYLQLEEPRKALAATAACVTNCPDHSLRTYPSVLLRRAVAHELLGHEALADADYSLAAHLAVEFFGLRPVLGVPMEIIERLHFRLLENEPALREQLGKRISVTATYPGPAPLNFEVAQLTKREEALAHWIVTDLTITAIAAKLSVSPNTVKTQLRSLYRKLGVDSRRDAVDRLERTGIPLHNPDPE